MAEYTNNTAQTVAANQNVLFTETPVDGSNCIVHRDGSGIITLRGITNQCRARYKIFFGANIAIPTGGTVGAISVGISVNGEALSSATAIVTPTADNNYSNIAVSAYIDVPKGCCVTISAKNTSTQAISVVNSNLIAERVA